MSGPSRDGACRTEAIGRVTEAALCMGRGAQKRGERCPRSQTLCRSVGVGTVFIFGVQRDGIDTGDHTFTAALFSWSPRHLISISFLSSPAWGLTLYIRWKALSRKIFDSGFSFVINEGMVVNSVICRPGELECLIAVPN